MTTKTKKTPATPKLARPHPDRFVPSRNGMVRPDAATLERWNEEAAKTMRATVLPELHAKHGSPTIPEGADPLKYEVDKVCLREYTSRKHAVLAAMAAASKKNVEASRLFVHITNEELNTMSKTEKETPAQQRPTSTKEAKTEQIETKHGTFRKGSVLHAIYRSFELKEGATKAEILERLVKEFPDRKAEDMESTINTQINRMPKERGFDLGRDDKGRYGLHIEGRSTKRVLSPEAQAKLDERRAKKEEREKKAAEKKAEKAAKEKAKAEAKAAKEKAEAEKAAKVKVNVPGAKVVGQVKK